MKEEPTAINIPQIVGRGNVGEAWQQIGKLLSGEEINTNPPYPDKELCAVCNPLPIGLTPFFCKEHTAHMAQNKWAQAALRLGVVKPITCPEEEYKQKRNNFMCERKHPWPDRSACWAHYLNYPNAPDGDVTNPEHLPLYRVIYILENSNQEPPTKWGIPAYLKYFAQGFEEDYVNTYNETEPRKLTALGIFKKGYINGGGGGYFCSPECALEDFAITVLMFGEWWAPEEGYGS
jgi:hypothetical protein